MIQKIKTAITIIILFLIFSSVSMAQEFRAGGGLGYGTVAKNIGLNFRGDIQFDKQWSVAPHFNWFFNKKSDGITKRWNAFNIDGHYYFEIEIREVFAYGMKHRKCISLAWTTTDCNYLHFYLQFFLILKWLLFYMIDSTNEMIQNCFIGS